MSNVQPRHLNVEEVLSHIGVLLVAVIPDDDVQSLFAKHTWHEPFKLLHFFSASLLLVQSVSAVQATQVLKVSNAVLQIGVVSLLQ